MTNLTHVHVNEIDILTVVESVVQIKKLTTNFEIAHKTCLISVWVPFP